jgi:membrane-associated protease RseP (regulator of RpoE activity)
MSPAAAPDQGGPATPPAEAAAEQPQSEAEQPQSKSDGPRWVVALVLVLVLGVGGGFLLGRATAPDDGPSSLADAVSQTAKGDLPVGQLDLQELLQSIGKQKGGALGQILGGGSGSKSDSVGGLLGGLLDQLHDRIGNGSSGNPSGAVLGVSVQAAPTGQTGVQVQAVAPGSAAADAGLQANDVITAVDGKAVTSPAELAKAVQSHDPGDQVTITYTRNGTSATVNVHLGNGSSATTSTTSPATTQPPSNA